MKRLYAKFIKIGFWDNIACKYVNYYECKDGTRFMAYSKFDSLFFYVKVL